MQENQNLIMKMYVTAFLFESEQTTWVANSIEMLPRCAADLEKDFGVIASSVGHWETRCLPLIFKY